ncbi:MAG: hypothetical protein ABSH47_19350 [Bryobacteraceae bacterium]|jgi:hypothetical protein
MFADGGFTVLSLRTGAPAYPKEQTGLVAAIGAGSWSAIFVAVGLISVAGTLFWFLLTAG